MFKGDQNCLVPSCYEINEAKNTQYTCARAATQWVCHEHSKVISTFEG